MDNKKEQTAGDSDNKDPQGAEQAENQQMGEESGQDGFPDTVNKPPEPSEAEKRLAQIQDEYKRLKAEYEKEAEERAVLEKRLKDNRDYIARQAGEKAVKPESAGKTIVDYRKEVERLWEEDGPQAAVWKIVTDVIHDRNAERSYFEQRIKEAEERAYYRALMSDPGHAELLAKAEQLEAERPDLAGLTIEQKLEWVKMREMAQGNATGGESRRNIVADRIERERAALSVPTGRTMSSRGKTNLPEWTNDPAVIQEARKAGFQSKEDLANWATMTPERAAAIIRNRKSQ